MTKAEYLEEWFARASDDLTIIRQAMDRPPDEWVHSIICFHAQQAVEKAFKAYLVSLDRDPPRTHSLEILYHEMSTAGSGVPAYDLGDLTTYAVQSRYPGVTYTPTTEETIRYARLAEDIVGSLHSIVLGRSQDSPVPLSPDPQTEERDTTP